MVDMSSFYLKLAEKEAKKNHGGHLTVMRFTSGWKAIFGTPSLDCEDGRFEFCGLQHHTTMDGALIDLLSHGYSAWDGRSENEKKAESKRRKLETDESNDSYVDLSALEDACYECTFSDQGSGKIFVLPDGLNGKYFDSLWGGPVPGCYDEDGMPVMDGSAPERGFVIKSLFQEVK